MSVRTWPGYAIAAFRWHKANQSSVFKSMFGSQSLEASTPLWEVSMSGVSEARAAARLIEAYIDSLNGFTDQIEIWNVEHPAPTGTMRGVMTLSGAEAQGSTSLDIVTSYGTNLLTFPEAFDNAAWHPFNATITPNTTLAPDGTVTADTATNSAASSGFAGASQVVPVTNGATYSVSFFMRAGNVNFGVIYATDSTQRFAVFNLVTGVVAVNPVGATAAITPAGGGWYRCSITCTVAGASYDTAPGPSRGVDRTSNPADYVYVWGAKLEAGAIATDYGFGKTLLKGDLLGLGSGLTQQVVPVSADAVSTGQGNITVSVGIPLRNAFSLGAAVTWDKPKALFRQKTLFDGMQYKPDGADVWSLSLREDWRL